MHIVDELIDMMEYIIQSDSGLQEHIDKLIIFIGKRIKEINHRKVYEIINDLQADIAFYVENPEHRQEDDLYFNETVLKLTVSKALEDLRKEIN